MSRIYIPQKRIYQPNDPFFEEGNIALRAIWLKKQAESDLEIDIIQQEENELTKELNVTTYCDHCRAEFPSIAAYEHHYEAVHRNVCSVCDKVFPGSDWLELHLDELHDVLLQMKKERGEKIHKCYVADCTKVFSEPRMRRLHLVDKHHYPKHFPFDLVYTGTLTFEQRKLRDQKNKERMERIKEKDNKEKDATSKDMDMDELTANMSKLRIPKSISFGHHKKPTIPQHRHNYNTKSKNTVNNNNNTMDAEMKEGEEVEPAEEKKVYLRPRKRGPKKKRAHNQVIENMIE